MTWKDQIEELKIPYPQKVALAHEIAEHLEHFPDEKNNFLENENLAELYQIHNTAALKYLEGLHPKIRSSVEFVFAVAPITALLIYLKGENFMFDFIQQGGAGMYAILAVGGLLLLREILLTFRVIVIKDHSKGNLNIDTQTAVIGALALMFLGICATGLGTYWAASYVEHKELPTSIFITGLRESVTCLIVSSSIATLILLMHFFTRRTLIKWKAPLETVG